MELHPYLFFNGRCEEAIAFYCEALGAKLTFSMKFKDCPPLPGMTAPAAPPENVMHATLKFGNTILQLSDGQRDDHAPSFAGFQLTVSASTEAEADRLFNALAAGGTVHMPLAKTFFSPRFGMLKDRFGVSWMVTIETAS